MLRSQVKYKSFEVIDEEKKWWRIPFISEFLKEKGFDASLKTLIGSETVPASQFVQYAFGQLKAFNDASLPKDGLLSSNKDDNEVVNAFNNSTIASDQLLQVQSSSEITLNDRSSAKGSNLGDRENDNMGGGHCTEPMTKVDESTKSNTHFWKNFADVINHNVVQKLDLPLPEKFKWDGLDLLNRIGLQSLKIAEAGYIESGLATPGGQDVGKDKASVPTDISTVQSSLPDIKKATQDLLRQTDTILGALMVLTTAVPHFNKEALFARKSDTEEQSSTKIEGDIHGNKGAEILPGKLDGTLLDEKKSEEMKALFSTAESAMEAWAMLATSLGHPTFIKSEFEKICFLDNETTDTQVAIWRDVARKRLVVAFRGTEQSKWKDLITDLMLVPAGLNPERIGGEFKQEVQVHSGFLSAYDSVRMRIISLIKLLIGYMEDAAQSLHKWNVYVTGHSLGGALATLLALELASSQLAKHGVISVTMYNFGSPRVGNKRFADIYNEKVKDSWRVVNHRDIIPTVPRLMGYCHVAQPIYLAAGDLRDALENMELMKDGYHGDVIGESTPDVLVSEFMKGEKELVEKILQTEINIFRAIRDGSALMQHMEDFYYITLLENVRSNYQNVARVQNNEEGSASIS